MDNIERNNEDKFKGFWLNRFLSQDRFSTTQYIDNQFIRALKLKETLLHKYDSIPL